MCPSSPGLWLQGGGEGNFLHPWTPEQMGRREEGREVKGRGVERAEGEEEGGVGSVSAKTILINC